MIFETYNAFMLIALLAKEFFIWCLASPFLLTQGKRTVLEEN